MVRSELYQLERLVGEIVKDEQLPGNEINLGIAQQVQAVADYCADLKLKWVHELFSAVKEPVLARYVQYHQAGITSLSNQVSLRIPQVFFQGTESRIHQCYFTIVSCLEELLRFLEQGFYKYFDRDYSVSIDRYRIQADEIMQAMAETKTVLQQSDIDSSLVTCITLSVINKLTDAKQTGISYRQLDGCKFLMGTIRQQVHDKVKVTTIDIARQLYRQNFNSYYFSQWYQEYLSNIINAVPEAQSMALILQEIKGLDAVFVDRDKMFEPELPSINELLLPWLRQFLPAPSNLKGRLKMNGPERMPLQFSVTQFALFIRLCYLEGCFPINNISAILRFFTGHFETKKQPHISFKSFARAFYSADQATAAVVRDFLQRMINTVNKTYFP